MGNWTGGEWKSLGRSVVAIKDNEEIVIADVRARPGDMWGQNSPKRETTAGDNAALMSAAPDMHELLEWALSESEAGDGYCQMSFGMQNRIRRALAKARGEA